MTASSGAYSGGAINALAPGSSQNLYNVGGETLTLAVAANGSVTIQRTAGTLTYSVQLDLIWL